jgi:hypothetical protein
MDNDMKKLYKEVGYGLILVFLGCIAISASIVIAAKLFHVILGG